MNGSEFIRRARRYARRTNRDFHIDRRRGKGSHTLVCIGERQTIVKHGELSQRGLMGLFKQLDIDRERF